MIVLAFDRDWTVDVNPHPNREAVPLDYVKHWNKKRSTKFGRPETNFSSRKRISWVQLRRYDD